MHWFKDVASRRVIRTVLERAGSEPAAAAQISDHLVDANFRGHAEVRIAGCPPGGCLILVLWLNTIFTIQMARRRVRV